MKFCSESLSEPVSLWLSVSSDKNGHNSLNSGPFFQNFWNWNVRFDKTRHPKNSGSQYSGGRGVKRKGEKVSRFFDISEVVQANNSFDSHDTPTQKPRM